VGVGTQAAYEPVQLSRPFQGLKEVGQGQLRDCLSRRKPERPEESGNKGFWQVGHLFPRKRQRSVDKLDKDHQDV
jgi:hypothetical protein